MNWILFFSVSIAKDMWSFLSQLAWEIMKMLTQKDKRNYHNFTQIMMSSGT